MQLPALLPATVLDRCRCRGASSLSEAAQPSPCTTGPPLQMHEYCLARDDIDFLLEVTKFKTRAPWLVDPMKDIETQTKSAFTRWGAGVGGVADLPGRTQVLAKECSGSGVLRPSRLNCSVGLKIIGTSEAPHQGGHAHDLYCICAMADSVVA